MINQQEKTQTGTALWCCQQCSIWWGSQLAEEPETWSLFRLHKPLTNPLLWPDEAPAWKIAGPDPSVCPQCGAVMMKRETATLEAPGHYYN